MRLKGRYTRDTREIPTVLDTYEYKRDTWGYNKDTLEILERYLRDTLKRRPCRQRSGRKRCPWRQWPRRSGSASRRPRGRRRRRQRSSQKRSSPEVSHRKRYSYLIGILPVSCGILSVSCRIQSSILGCLYSIRYVYDTCRYRPGYVWRYIWCCY
jgi:hypothetical protein